MVRIATPLRGAAQRFALGFLILSAFGLMFLGKADNNFVERLRTTVTDVATPVLEIAAAPISAVNGAIDHVRALAALHEENVRLREEVERLRSWHAAALRLEAENTSFRDMLNYRGPERNAFVSARVVADGRGPFVKSLLVNIGSRDGIQKGHAAVTQLGLVGRVTEVGERSARILMMTDLNSRIPVLIEDTRARAILAGDNTERPQLVFLPDRTQLRPGQRVVTSGHGGGLPHGIPVGVVSGVEKGIPRIRPFVDWGRLEYVEIIDYDVESVPAILPAGRAGKSGTPPPGAGTSP
ncbi:MAG: rod shape-determining protein MreC [Alphaproteobacteria bacterium]